MDFSDVDNASSDVGAEVSEVENKDIDFGDGDGVNDFDETYSEMNSGGETLEYAGESEKTDSSDFDENKSNDITEESVNDELEDFDDSPTVDGEENLETDVSDDSSISRSEMTTDESVEDALADFEDDSDSIVEDVKESDANLDEEVTEETDDTEYETGDSEVTEANDAADKFNDDGSDEEELTSDEADTLEENTETESLEDDMDENADTVNDISSEDDVTNSEEESADDSVDEMEDSETSSDDIEKTWEDEDDVSVEDKNEVDFQNDGLNGNQEDAGEQTSDEIGNDDIREEKNENSEISKDLEDSLRNFEQEKWDSLSLEEKKDAIANLSDSTANDLGLNEKPEIKFYNVEDASDFGGYSARENTIYINEYNMGDAVGTADTIAHESRHCWQHERAENPKTPQDYEFKENFEDYVSPSDDYQEYRNQPVEVDAREYAVNVCNHIEKNAPETDSSDVVDVKKSHSGDASEMSPEKGAVFDNRPESFEGKVELQPISKMAIEKCESAGLSEEKVDEIRKIPNGEKPDPKTYLEGEYIENHLAKFNETGCYKIIGDRRGEPTGTIGEGQDGVFVLNGADVDKMIEEADGDPRKLEEALSLPDGYLGDNPYIIRCDEPHNLRMATGNESNAWQDEWCPAGTTRGGTDEAVIDPMEKGEYSYRHVFGNEEWRK